MNILVSGLINIETTLSVEAFPIDYRPQRFPFFGVKTTVSGVGYNITRALTILGHQVNFLSLIGEDTAGTLVWDELQKINVSGINVVPQLAQTCQSVIIYDTVGKRASFTDLKDIQEQTYPPERLTLALQQTDLAVLCNINYNRPMLAAAQAAGISIATDVHTIRDIEDEYNQDFMAHADVLFQSDENLPCPPEEWAQRLQTRYGTAIIVIGMGTAGALLAVKADNRMERIRAVYIGPVVNTIGAGDALFAAFIHTYSTTKDPYLALQKAVVFASYKIGVSGAADGFLDSAGLETWYSRTQP